MARDRYRAVVRDALPGTRKEVREKCGLPTMTVFHWIKRMKEDGEIYIAGWKRRIRGAPIPVYKLGNKPDVPCDLKPLGNAVASAKYIAKLRQEGTYETRARREIAVRSAKRIAKKQHSWLAALGL
jgi:predicted ArsR family transcriptional regulator